MNFIASPELVIALALGGRLSFNPITDQLSASDGTKFNLIPPRVAPEIPQSGFKHIWAGGYLPPSEEPGKIDVVINKNSERLQKRMTISKMGW